MSSVAGHHQMARPRARRSRASHTSTIAVNTPMSFQAMNTMGS
jgi:hypothetical protein